MPSVMQPAVFAAAYQAMRALLDDRRVPTRQLYGNQHVFRSVAAQYLPRPAAGGFPNQAQQNAALSPFDEGADRNRWSGASPTGGIPASGGLYCVLQQQALVNEVMHYHKGQKGPVGAFDPASFANKAIVKIRLNQARLLVDLSAANPTAKDFLAVLLAMVASGSIKPPRGAFPHTNALQIQRALGADDCSIPRGIGLAIAQSGFARGLIVPTMRFSERSIYERGDNAVFFGPNGAPIAGLTVEEITYP
ncbi:MAG: hypothetical protein NW208_02840 [Bryobacter sp.]|nr:hypothetical protein [Bryobacter sp.]